MEWFTQSYHTNMEKQYHACKDNIITGTVLTKINRFRHLHIFVLHLCPRNGEDINQMKKYYRLIILSTIKFNEIS